MALWRYAAFYFAFLGKTLKSRAADPGDFWIEALSVILYQGLGLAFLSVIFGHVTGLAGWSFGEVLFIFGAFQVVTSLFYLFFPWTLWFSDHYLVRRGLDVILVRPLPPFLQVMAEGAGAGLSELTGVVLGAGIIAFASQAIGWQPTITDLALFILALFCGMLILGGMFTSLAMFGFWAKTTNSAATPLMEILEFGQYPLTIYPSWLRWAFTFLLPLGFVAFVPSAMVLGREARTWVGFGWLWALGIWAFAVLVWRRGLRRYESAGN